jgi:hypothetical protein
MGIVVLLSIVETSRLNWILHGVWSCLQHLHVLVPNSRSLKIALFFGWMGPLLELLLDSRHGRVDLAVGSLRGYRCHIRAVSLIGTDISKVTLLSTVVALLVS